jgi:hypothetical protein
MIENTHLCEEGVAVKFPPPFQQWIAHVLRHCCCLLLEEVAKLRHRGASSSVGQHRHTCIVKKQSAPYKAAGTHMSSSDGHARLCT